MPMFLRYPIVAVMILCGTAGCIVIEEAPTPYRANVPYGNYQAPADNDTQYVPPRGYNNGYYSDNDSQYVPPRGYKNNDEDYYYPLYDDY